MENKLFTTRFFQPRRTQKIWVYHTKKGILHHVASSFDNYAEKHVHDGSKWIKPPKNGKLVELASLPQSYEEFLELVREHGHKIAGQLIGYDLNSFGDAAQFYALAYLEKYGQKFVDYLNEIAAIDGKILSFCGNKNLSYKDGWFYTGKDLSNSIYCFPFVGQHLYVTLLGFPTSPDIDVIKLHDNISIFLEFVDSKKDVENMSLYEMLVLTIGEESANWVKNNLSIDA